MSSPPDQMANRRATSRIELDAVQRVVAAARRSRRWSDGLAVVLASTIAGLGAAGLCELATLSGAVTLPEERFLGTVLMTGSLAFVLALAGFGAVATRRRPSGLAMARWIDRRLALKERLSTAMEATGWPIATSREAMLRQALFADAQAAADAVIPAQVSDRRSWRWAFALPVLATGVFALGAMHQGRERPAPQISAPVAVTAEERVVTETVLREIADLIRQDEKAQTTPVLQALARTVDAVRNDISTGALDRSELAQALSGLAAQVGQASAELSGSTGARIEQALGERISAIERGPEAAPGGAAQKAPPDAPRGTGAPNKPLPTAGAAQTTLQPNQAKPEGSQYYSPDPHQLSREMAERAQSQPSTPGTPAGGARNSDRGGNQAGDGVRPLVASMEELAALSASRLETMILPRDDASAGQRVRINTLPPDATPGAAVDGGAETGGWQAGETEPFNRHGDPLGNVEILKRYFPRSGGEF